MRAYWLGLAGGITAIIIAGALVGAFLLYRSQSEPGRARTELLAEIDEYEAWYIANSALNAPLTVNAYKRNRDAFIARHPTLEQYVLWWQNERNQTEAGGSLAGKTMTDLMRPEDLRDPAMVDAYLAR